MMWPRCSTAMVSACAPGTTAPCRSTMRWACPRARAHRSTATRSARTWTRWSRDFCKYRRCSRASPANSNHRVPEARKVPMDELFRDHILDHYRHPRCHGTLENADASVEDANPLCGDKLRMDFRFADGRVAEVRFTGSGCSISQASASLLCEAIEGRTLEEVKAISRQD